ncbi:MULTISPECIES: DUF4197 family protein [Chryseobacterium]|uniref:DUF4197 family protein n=1 Tax=Chryseobacterium TaxID=59732 RepID=UPI00235846B6|nr:MULTISPECIES: DUF4197 family protein [unclassified Chryseobacterium]MDC8104452.1 DUF4197 domain-containing protein [Chryseobacterium sp. B21-037]MDQ1804066.1 DUF4197 family protein [Chryseobacterium sp. CKR4-1]
MKKYILAIALVAGTATVITTSVQSCTSLATTDLGLSIIKKFLLNGIDKGMNIYGNKDAFLQNNLVDKALPKELRDINSMLEKISPSLVAKEREYVAEAASYTVNISKPILQNAVNSLNAQDVTRIIQGEKGTATLILKEKTSDQLVAAITPKVDEQLNRYGIVKTINTALAGSNFLGNLLGGNSNTVNSGGLSKLASEQLVNGLFNIIEDYEIKNSKALLGPLGK